MEELINQITQQTGISNDQAHQAVQVVANFLKTNLPAPIASQVDSALSGNTMGDLSNQAGQVLGGLSGMFGKKD